jgi:hypothetical protein
MLPSLSSYDASNVRLDGSILSGKLGLRHQAGTMTLSDSQNLLRRELRCPALLSARYAFWVLVETMLGTACHPALRYGICLVLVLCSQPEMVEIRATPIRDVTSRIPHVTCMTYDQADRYWPICQRPDNAGCREVLMLQTERPITIDKASSQPHPTLILSSRVNLRPESLDVLPGQRDNSVSQRRASFQGASEVRMPWSSRSGASVYDPTRLSFGGQAS